MNFCEKVSMLEAALKGSVDKIQADERSLQSRHQAQLNAEKQVNLKLRAESALLKKNVTRFRFFLYCYNHYRHLSLSLSLQLRSKLVNQSDRN